VTISQDKDAEQGTGNRGAANTPSWSSKPARPYGCLRQLRSCCRSVVPFLLLVQVFVFIAVVINDWGGITTWTTWRCAIGYVYDAHPLHLAHFRRSKEGLRSHYNPVTWGGGKGVTASQRLGAIVIGEAEIEVNNECPANNLRPFVKYQRLAMTMPWDQRPSSVSEELLCLPASISREPHCRKHFLVLETVWSGEPIRLVREWIEHHLFVGYNHIYMSIDSKPDRVEEAREALKPFVERGVISIFGSFGGVKRGHMHFQTITRNTSFWVSRHDVDEFIVPPAGDLSIVPFLRKLTGRHRKVPLAHKIPRTQYGDAGWEEEPPLHVSYLEAFNRSQAMPNNVKSIYLTDLLDTVEPTFNDHEITKSSAGVTCQDTHFLSWFAIFCWPQFQHIYWFPQGVPKHIQLPLRPPISQILWEAANKAER